VGEVSPLNALAAQYRDRGFEFLTIYVREPHPGEHYGPHASMEQKLQGARDCQVQDDVRTRLVVDDLAGTMHRAYGMLPNMIYVLDREGRAAYKAMWTDHADLAAALANFAWADDLQARGVRVKPSYVERLAYVPATYADGLRERVFDRAGPQAYRDYESVYPTSH
jgi:hypothetical protein